VLEGELSGFNGAVGGVGGDGSEMAVREEEVGLVGSQEDLVSVGYLAVGYSEDAKKDKKEKGEGRLRHY
jgi:hypothetical protein